MDEDEVAEDAEAALPHGETAAGEWSGNTHRRGSAQWREASGPTAQQDDLCEPTYFSCCGLQSPFFLFAFQANS